MFGNGPGGSLLTSEKIVIRARAAQSDEREREIPSEKRFGDFTNFTNFTVADINESGIGVPANCAGIYARSIKSWYDNERNARVGRAHFITSTYRQLA